MKSALIIFLCFACSFPVVGQTSSFTIKTNNPDPVQFCKDSVLVADALTIEGSPNIKGMKVSISEGYNSVQDELILKNAVGGITGTWYPQQGYLILSGSSDVGEYEAALRQIRYHNKSSSAINGKRKITISLDDVDFLPATGHFYRYIEKTGINWSEARIQAERMSYYGLHGYLVTITSAEENAFIQQKTKGDGWIGASDEESEGMWKWVTGPEGLNGGTLFWKGSGYQAKTNPANYGPVNNAYQNWNRWDIPYSGSLSQYTWEPNESPGGEDYAHITYFPNNPNESLRWNDQPDTGGSGDYAAQGYIVEFGGMPGDPVVSLVATIELQVNNIHFDDKREFTICKGDTVTLNRKGPSGSYLWSPSLFLSSDSAVSPVAQPVSTTVFTATIGACKVSADFKVNVNPLPVSLLMAEENICQGTTISLNPGIHNSYLWSNGSTTSTIQVSTEGLYTVQLKTSLGCKLTDTVKVFVHQNPKNDLSQLDTLICGNKSTVVNITTNAQNFSLNSSDSRVTITGLQLNVSEYGTFPVHYQAIDQYCKSDTSFKISFHNIPTEELSVDSVTCYGYNLNASYLGDADVNKARFIWVFGGDTIANGIGRTRDTISLGINPAKRNLLLTVIQDGCSNSSSLNAIKVIPDLKLHIADSLDCEPFNAEFTATNTENVLTYDWNFGDGTHQITTSHPFHIYQNHGFYNVNLKVTTEKGCTNEATIDSMVHVVPIPTAGFSLDPKACLNLGNNVLNYSGTADQSDTFQWDLSDLDTPEIVQNPGITQGPLIFNLTNRLQTKITLQAISKYGCKSAVESLVLKRKPAFSITTASNHGCTPLETGFNALASDVIDQLSFQWDFGDGTTDTGSNATHTYVSPGRKYDIKLVAFSALTGCSDTLTERDLVNAYPKPAAAFSMDNPVAYNDKPDVKFINQSLGAADYSWSFGDGSISLTENPVHKFSAIGCQSVLLQVFNEYACTDTISHSVLVALSKIFPPNAFSPNAPNPVDRQFRLSSDGVKQDGYHFVIISRWNDIVFETKGEIKGWDGKMQNGSFAPAGSYLWVLNFTDFLGRQHRQTGAVSLVY